tara:strand:+ start:1634 stop:2068 length:435 start_codon:yes stop_codon:yes gene_type:complete
MKKDCKFKIGRKILSRRTDKPPCIKTKYAVLIWQLIKEPNDLCAKDWARETKAAKELFELYPNLDFWSQINLGFYLNSLNFFKNKDGQKHFKKAVEEFEVSCKLKFGKVKEEKFDEQKTFDKDIKSNPKKTSYIDLFKSGKKTK